MNKKIIIPAVSIALLGSVVTYGLTSVKAETNTPTEFPPLVQKLISKFNLNKDEVSKIMEQDRSERQAEMQKRFEEKLTELVKTEKLTENQKTALISKHNEMKANKQNIREMTREERQNKMQEEKSKYEEWSKSQGIDLSLLRPEGKGFGRHK